MARTQISWPPVLERAAVIVRAEPGGMSVRALDRRLVGEGILPDTEGAYGSLSAFTSKGKREGSFPDMGRKTRPDDDVRRSLAAERRTKSPAEASPVACAAPSLALRVKAVAEANRRNDLEVLAGELDLLIEAANEWAASVRARLAALPEPSRNTCAF